MPRHPPAYEWVLFLSFSSLNVHPIVGTLIEMYGPYYYDHFPFDLNRVRYTDNKLLVAMPFSIQQCQFCVNEIGRHTISQCGENLYQLPSGLIIFWKLGCQTSLSSNWDKLESTILNILQGSRNHIKQDWHCQCTHAPAWWSIWKHIFNKWFAFALSDCFDREDFFTCFPSKWQYWHDTYRFRD